MKLLSLNTSHDGCLTYIVNNKIIFHTQIDRYNRFKHFTFPTKNLINIIKKLDYNLLIHSCSASSSMRLWKEVLDPNIKILDYGFSKHHIFHAYCALAWNKKINKILICDGTGSTINGITERESIYENKKCLNIFENKIGLNYEKESLNFFKKPFQENKYMALSLYNKIAKNSQIKYSKNMDNFINLNVNENFHFTGGCAQNVLYNSLLLKKYKDIFCDPFNGDFGISLGAANYYLNNKLKIDSIYLGIPQKITTDEFYNYKIIDVTYENIAKILLTDVVAIFQSRSEQGQRGLGNRSLLISPILKNSFNKLNKIKNREYYRPFACSVLKEDAQEWFDMEGMKESPYMMFVFKVLKSKRKILKNGFSINNTSRIQTVDKKRNYHFFNLIKAFKKVTNVPILVNTSLNLPEEVLVETLSDMKEFFEKSCLKYLYLPEINKLVIKNE